MGERIEILRSLSAFRDELNSVARRPVDGLKGLFFGFARLRQYSGWMTRMKTDQELLRDYVHGAAEGGFEALVQRHLNLVFGTAFRGLGDAAAAEEIAQNVFVALAGKAVWLLGQPSLAA